MAEKIKEVRKGKVWVIKPENNKFLGRWDMLTSFALMWTATVTPFETAFLPVVLGPHPQAYSGRVDFASFVVHLSDRAFLRDPMSAVRALRAISADEIARRKAALALHRADVLYDLRDSRAGDHFLAEVAEHCLPNLLPELAAENGWNRTALPAAPRLPASCGRAAALARKLATS